MARDSLFGEEVLWSGRPRVLAIPLGFKIAALASAAVSVSTLCFALVVGLALRVHVDGMLIMAAWFATLALGAWRLPLLWRSRVEYLVTDHHVIWRRGKLRRTIERNQISYARILWSRHTSGVGDLVVVRAVPTGALRRTLTLTLADVEAPDRLWALVRGIAPSAPLGDGERPLAQRLDDGERVLWSAVPMASPWGWRRIASALLAVVLGLAAIRLVAHGATHVLRLSRSLAPAPLGLLVVGMALAALLLSAVAVGIGYSAWVRPVRLTRATRYFVTNRRVLIRRGHEELHLDRARIAYVIAAPRSRASSALSDLFLVLDGPQARALAASGAFRTADPDHLEPMFSAIEDAETVGAILGPNALKDAA